MLLVYSPHYNAFPQVFPALNNIRLQSGVNVNISGATSPPLTPRCGISHKRRGRHSSLNTLNTALTYRLNRLSLHTGKHVNIFLSPILALVLVH